MRASRRSSVKGALSAMPALLTSQSIEPNGPVSLRASSSAAAGEAASATSSASANALPPAPRIDSATFSHSARWRDATSTVAPSRATRLAIASPMPRLAPVTSATWRSDLFAMRVVCTETGRADKRGARAEATRRAPRRTKMASSRARPLDRGRDGAAARAARER